MDSRIHSRLTDQSNGRPYSAPPASSLNGAQPLRTSSGTSHKSTSSLTDRSLIPSFDLSPQLSRSGSSIVKTRTGSVLSRGFILKTDHYPTGRAHNLELDVHGAPNFRSPKHGNLNVFGVAQPRTQGLRAVLSILRCRPTSKNPSHCVWFSTREEPIVYISDRPFVLRDASEPRKTLALSDRTENLEGIEERLKQDILQESSKFGGLLLTHNEVSTDTGEGAIIPTWTSVDAESVMTSRELWVQLKKEGWHVDYHRIPISPERPIEDNYLDAYLQVIKETDPYTTSLVFSCGMGAVRTTFAMVAALIVRRKQVIMHSLGDPFEPRISHSSSGVNTPTSSQVVQVLEQANAQQELSKSLLRLTTVLQNSVEGHNRSVVETLITQPTLMENLRKSLLGNYGAILSLLGCLDNGTKAKKLVDRTIDACDQVVNLREEILINRIRYSMTSLDEKGGEAVLNRAVKAIEKYFFMIAFASYVEDQSDFSESFSDWMKTRTEIWNQVTFLRKQYGSRLNVFAPINDLSAMSKTSSERQNAAAGMENDIAISGGQILGDEYSEHVVRNRRGIVLREGTLLKSDQWLSESQEVAHGVRGAISFRNIPGTSIYALGQPTTSAIDEVVDRVMVEHPNASRVVWVTLREEPIVYVNGAPFCLRRESFTLRNMKDYGGISASRLEALEERLRDDIITELAQFGGKLLLHTETSDGSVIPVWEDVQPHDVEVLRDVMEKKEKIGKDITLSYRRIPITAEKPPDFSDLSDLMDVVIRNYSSNTPMIFNCQLGRGRSTLTSIIVLLIQQWLQTTVRTRARSQGPVTPGINHPPFFESFGEVERMPMQHSYQIINNLLRVIRNGLLIKATVDQAIDQCAELTNLRDSIEEARINAEQASTESAKKLNAQRGLQNLRRYFELIIFQWYLQSNEPDTIRSIESIETFVQHRPVIKTFEKELLAEGSHALKPLERVDLADGVALPDEERQIVANRSGSILSASTILKSDFFSNLQKMSLPERIEGSPNFRRIPLTLRTSKGISDVSDDVYSYCISDGKMICGSGMPTVAGLRRALTRVGAHPQGHNKVFWTSLREEPVLYVAGRPHVLRLVDRPLENVEATGVTTQVVEAMETRLKRDVIREVSSGGGRILLHDEVEERPGVFSIIPQWETVDEDDIMTPRDVFDLMAREGFKIDYDRVAITDEQAPLPDALFQIFERVQAGLKPGQAGDFVFNCQMGRGRTTTGMITACLISSIAKWNGGEIEAIEDSETMLAASESYPFDSLDGPSEEEVYQQGEYKVILQLVGVLSNGKFAKRLADRAIDHMQDVQNLRKAIYDYKLKVEACAHGSEKQKTLMNLGINYLYRYGALIVFANYLIERRREELVKSPNDAKAVLASVPTTRSFPAWLKQHREITTILGRRSLS